MKTTVLTVVCAIALGLASATPARAGEVDSLSVAADALVARPICFVATIVGSAIFLVALPAAATSGSIDSTADFLVMQPAWATFKRPMGDFGFASETASAAPQKGAEKLIARNFKGKSKTARQ